VPELAVEELDVFINNTKEAIVKNFSMRVSGGELHVLMGPNGSGKTTLVKAIGGHRKYKVKGAITMDGEDIKSLETHERAKRGLGIALQEPPPLEGLRVSEVLIRVAKKFRGLGGSEAYRFIVDVLRTVGLGEEILSKYHMFELSGGEKRKLELARILIMNPKVAILDEPDSGVDIDSIPKIATAISKLKASGAGVLLITHQFAIFDYLKPDRVHVMLSGRKVAEGSSELIEVLRERGYRALSRR